MTSSVTNSFNEVLLGLFKKDVDSAAVNYYVGLARSEVFSETEDNSSPYFQSQLRHSIQAVKTLASSSFVVPYTENIHQWNQNVIYDEYDNGVGTNYYVINSSNEVFICIETARTIGFQTNDKKPSTVEPTSTLALAFGSNGTLAKTFRTSDQYKWRYLYKLSNLAIATFKSNAWLPVKKITDRAAQLPIPEEQTQRSVQDSAVAGQILSIAIDSAGSGYSTLSPPTITITGNGDSASFTCDIASNGQIARVRVDSNGNGVFAHGFGYDYATAVLSTGNGKLRPVIGPRAGVNADPVDTLKTRSLMLQVDFANDEFDTILAQNDFSQVCVMRNIKSYAGADFTGNTGLGVANLDVNNTGNQLTNDEVFKDGALTAVGKTMYHDTTANKLYYYQDETTNFIPFTLADPNLTSVDNDYNLTFTAVNNPDIDKYSGEILYINNLGGEGLGTTTTNITRDPNQTEDIRIVIQLG